MIDPPRMEQPPVDARRERRRPPPRRPQTARIVALLAVVFVLGLLAGRVFLHPPSTPPPVVATQDVSVVTVTEGAETVTVTK
jgi:hypothetical protein